MYKRQGCDNARAGKHIITTCFEHAAVYEPLLYLEKMGYEVTYLPVDSMGHVSCLLYTSIVEMHHGQIRAESADETIVFEVELPCE